MHAGVVTGELEGHGVRVAADNGGLFRRQPAGRLRQARLGGLSRAHKGRALGRVGDLEFLDAGHGAHTARDGALEGLLRGVAFARGLAVADGGRHVRNIPLE